MTWCKIAHHNFTSTFSAAALNGEHRGAYLGFEGHAQRQVGRDLQEGDLAVGVLQQGRGGVGAVHQDDLEPMAMAQVTQLAGKVHVRWRRGGQVG